MTVYVTLICSGQTVIATVEDNCEAGTLGHVARFEDTIPIISSS